jgi:ketosteroid isomerase-like protein
MTSPAWLRLSLAFAVLLPLRLHGQQDVPDSAGIATLRDRFVADYNAGDASSLAALYTVDAVRLPYDAVAISGRAAVVDALRHSFAARRSAPTLGLQCLELHQLDDWAFERGTYHEIIRSRAGGPVFIEDGKYVAVLRRGPDHSWRYHWSIFNRDRPARPQPPS